MGKVARVVGLVALVVLMAAVTPASAITINFESDAPGSKPNGWTSNDSALVHFTDSVGEALDVEDYAWQGDGLSLGVMDDWDDSELIMDFDVNMDSISLDYGNDDPGWANQGDQAVLKLFLGGNQVGQVSQVMNLDDIMNQTISFSGASFDQATFKFAVTSGRGLIEIVDHIVLNEGGPTTIPEPTSLALLGLGLLGFVRRSRRQK